MKFSSLLSLLVTAFMSCFVLATTALSCAPVKGNPPNTGYVLDWCKYTAGMLFQWDLPTFLKHRDANFSLGRLTWDWSSDGCTMVADYPLGFPFKPACYRHDFGYQNYRVQFHFTPYAKWRIDNNFLKDMKFQCRGHNWLNVCHSTAHVYYWGVRIFGDSGRLRESEPPAIKVTETVESTDAPQFMDVFEEMDADEARDAANPNLPEEKIKEYYDRALVRYNKAVEEARAKGLDFMNHEAA